MIDDRQFFRALGMRIKKLRKTHGYTQEDMIGYGFSARHWQQIEAGRPITIRTLLRISATFDVKAADLIDGLDRGIYK